MLVINYHSICLLCSIYLLSHLAHASMSLTTKKKRPFLNLCEHFISMDHKMLCSLS